MLLRRLPVLTLALPLLALSQACKHKTVDSGDTSITGLDSENGDSASDSAADSGGDSTADSGGDSTADSGGDSTADSGGDSTADSAGDTAVTDADGDGYPASTDCDDSNAAVHPGATEICNGIDDNCDGVVDTDATDATTWYDDADADGYGDPGTGVASCTAPPGTVADNTDCDDTSARYHPGADESDCTDPNDYNCDGSVGYADADGDGYPACQDCNDASAAISPAASEVCDGVDNDCDSLTDDADPSVDPSTESTWYTDSDADTYGDAGAPILACSQPSGAVADDTDCDDTNPDANPSAAEVCNGIDDDCDGLLDDADPSLDASTTTTWYTDADVDGYGAGVGLQACVAPAGDVSDDTDCNDADPAYHPGADESNCADPNDYNCDGSVGYADADGDGYAACQDCNDGNGAINPAATEVCDGVDNNCDGLTDDADPALDATTETTWYTDADNDGYGGSLGTASCAAPSGSVADSTDCDDANGAINPGATEVCDGVDNDCDTLVDDADPSLDASTASLWYTDSDRDGYGAGTPVATCVAPADGVADGTDCDDANGAVHPGATEVCNGIDDDCDGAVDDADSDLDLSTASSWYADGDSDGYGAGTVMMACEAPANTVSDNTDCNDLDGAVNPAATEVCDGVDNDCNTLVDDADPGLDASTTSVWYADGDNDGYGVGSGTALCTAPAGSASLGGDCDDADGAINPGATEICDDLDNDCDGLVDGIDPSLDLSTATAWFADADDDGFGAGAPTLACNAPANTVTDDTDCNDGDGAINPAATEVCDGVDNDCDTLIDDADPSLDTSTASTFYADNDRDGYGAGSAIAACAQPAGDVVDNTDCNDLNRAINPGATEVCDGLNTDENCNGTADDADPTVDTATQTMYYPDADNDGYGATSGALYCDPPAGDTTDHADCDDANAAAHPGGTEICDNLDNDCDGAIDWGHRVPSDYPTIQSGIDASADGDTVCVEAGRYDEDIDLGGHAITLMGTDGSSATTIDGGGAGTVVTIASGEGLSTLVAGFTITNGNAGQGAGVYVSESSPTLMDLSIGGNICDAEACSGTGLYVAFGDPVLDSVAAYSNGATAVGDIRGVGAYFQDSSPTVTNSRFSENTAVTSGNVYGTGLYLSGDDGADASFSHIGADENITTLTNAGGGNQEGSVYVYGASPMFDHVTVNANEGYDGVNVWTAALYEENASSTWTNLQIVGNLNDSYFDDTAGLRENGASSSFTNVIIAGNQAIANNTILAAGAFLDGPVSPSFTNVDISGNSADGQGVAGVQAGGIGVTSGGSTVAFDNVIVAGNTTANTPSSATGGVYVGAAVSFAYCDLYGNTGSNIAGFADPAGTGGNISADPLYTDVSGADARSWNLALSAGSPAINTGDPGLLDSDGSRSNMGGYGGPGGAAW